MNVSLLCSICGAELNLEFNYGTYHGSGQGGSTWETYETTIWLKDHLSRRIPDNPATQAIRTAAKILGWEEEIIPGPDLVTGRRLAKIKMTCPEHNDTTVEKAV